jgi:hypothetical protein
MVFGVHLFMHFAHLIPWAAELFSNQGLLPEASASPLVMLFPNILAFFDGPIFVTSLVAFSALLSMALAFGFRDRAAALIIWYIAACLFGRNPLIQNPGLPYVGWLLLTHSFLQSRRVSQKNGSCPNQSLRPPGLCWLLAIPIAES